MIHAKIDAFMYIGIGTFPSKMKVALILCIFSSSDVGCKDFSPYFNLAFRKSNRRDSILI